MSTVKEPKRQRRRSRMQRSSGGGAIAPVCDRIQLDSVQKSRDDGLSSSPAFTRAPHLPRRLDVGVSAGRASV